MRRSILATVGALVMFGAAACGDDGGDEKSAAPAYTPPTVTNACDLLDLTVLNTWESTAGERNHTREENILGTVLSCEARNESTRLAAFALQAVVHKSAGEARSGYEMGVRFAKNGSAVTTGGGVSGLGSEAYFVWTKRDFDPTAMLNTASSYEIMVLDGTIELSLILNVAAPLAQADLADAAQQQARRVLEQLKG
ncbi:hypothetical protein ACWIGI_12705 [Nocardia sp. NPDC055321]